MFYSLFLVKSGTHSSTRKFKKIVRVSQFTHTYNYMIGWSKPEGQSRTQFSNTNNSQTKISLFFELLNIELNLIY